MTESSSDQDPMVRRRVPQPRIRHRIASGRGATEQPNATGDGPAALTPRFWVAIAATGIATGLFGAGLMLVLHTAQHLSFGYHTGMFEAAVERTGQVRRVVVLAVAGAFAGVAWYLLRRWTRGQKSEVHGTLWDGGSDLSFRRSLPSAVISEIVIGMGASLGREAAPQLMGAVSGSLLGRWANLSPPQRRLLLASGAGAGLAAVYNVPIGGAAITIELLYGRVKLPVVLPALACSFIATAASWIYLPDQATYTAIPAYHFATTQLVWALLAGPITGLVAVAWTRLIGWTSAHRPTGPTLLAAPLVAFAVLAVAALRHPQLLGNGKDMAHDAFWGASTFSDS